MSREWLDRRAHRLDLLVYPYRGAEDLLAKLDQLGSRNRCLCSDLSLGAWRPYWIYTELAQQLGSYREPEIIMPELESRDRESEARYNSIGRLVDRESEGRHLAMTAYQQARELLAAIEQQGIRCLMICAPRFGCDWGLDNSWLLYFLANGARQLGCTLLILSGTDEPLPPLPFAVYRQLPAATPGSPVPTWWAASTAPQLPGVVLDRSAHPADETLIDLSPYCWLKLPESRRSPEDNAWDGESGTAQHRAFLAYFSVNTASRALAVRALSSAARDCFAKGSHDLALRLYERAFRAEAPGRNRALLGLTLQMIRIAMMRFEAAAAHELGDASEAPELQGALSQTKGWGLLMSGKPREAESYLERARADYDPSSTDRSYLYLMNISALNQARLGNIAAALDWEQKIEVKLDGLERPDWQMRYVNALNHARLYKVTGDYVRSEAYYRRAFSINDGIRRPTDYVYFNFTLGQLCDQRQSSAEGLSHWLRAAMHWLSCTLPEALAPRMAGAILGRVSYRDVDDMEEIAHALCQGLSRSAQAAGLTTDPGAVPRICFQALEAPRGGRFDAALGADGWSCLVNATETQPALDGVAYRQLNALALHLIQLLQPNYRLPSRGTLWLDRQNGREVPTSFAELIDSVARREVADIYWGGARQSLSSRERKAFESRCSVSLGAGVDRLESVPSPAGALAVSFRRFLAPQLLSVSDSALLRSIGAGKLLPQLADELQLAVPDLENHVRALEERHILRCTVPSVQTS